MMKKYIFVFVSILLLSCTEKASSIKRVSGNALGTTYNILYFSETEFDITKGLDSLFIEVNKSVSIYLPESDISRINQGDTSVITDAIFKEVYRVSEEVYETSEGYFDPTVGILRNAYGFGDVEPISEIDSTILDSLRRFVGFNKVNLLENGRVQKKYPEIYFDFNAVAKGYAIDLIGNYLSNKGSDNYLIELGGEVLAKGKNLVKDKLWSAGIETVDSEIDNRSFLATVQLNNQALASSGNYRKFRINPRTGKKYVHTINPLTGFAEESDVTSATVIAPTCVVADAYATAFMAMGLERSKNVLEQLKDVEAYLTFTDETGAQNIYFTEGFSENLLTNALE